MANEDKDPIDEYDRQHGKPDAGAPKLSDNDAWGNNLNPVRETPLAGTNLRDVGR